MNVEELRVGEGLSNALEGLGVERVQRSLVAPACLRLARLLGMEAEEGPVIMCLDDFNIVQKVESLIHARLSVVVSACS